MSEAGLVHKLFDVSYQHTEYSPNFQEQQFYSDQYYWATRFRNITLNQLRAQVHLKKGAFSATPSVKWLQWNNYVYFNDTAIPAQYKADLSVVTSALNVALNKKHWIV